MCAIRWVSLLVLAAAPLSAQRTSVILTGVVSDSATARPLAGVLVALTGGARATRSDVEGRYVIIVPRAGEVMLEARRLGYAQRRFSVQIAENAEKVDVDITLASVQTLDTVRVRAADRALYGVVGTSRDLQPLEGAEVELLGSGRRTSSDKNGRFFIPIRSGRTFLVRARTKGYAAQMMSITIPDSGGLEVALLLDTSSRAYPKRLEMALDRFDERVKWKSNFGAVVPRVELLKLPEADMLFGIRGSRSFVAKGLRFGPIVCIYVDGQPRPGAPLWTYNLTGVEMVEAYAPGEYATRQLTESWPRNMPCSETGVPLNRDPLGGSERDIISHVVIWLKR